jgi:hypothetical protein
MDEVNARAAYRHAIARQLGQRLLLRRPVEAVRPVGDEFPEVLDVDPE